MIADLLETAGAPAEAGAEAEVLPFGAAADEDEADIWEEARELFLLSDASEVWRGGGEAVDRSDRTSEKGARDLQRLVPALTTGGSGSVRLTRGASAQAEEQPPRTFWE